MMKGFTLSKIVGTGALISSLAFVPLALPASAQNSPATSTDQTTQSSASRDRGPDWGWLGLIGLLGLAGLAGRKSEEPTRYEDPNVPTGTRIR